MSLVVSDMEYFCDPCRLRETGAFEGKRNLIVSGDGIRLIGYRFCIDDVISEFLVEIGSSSIREYASEKCDICRDKLSYHDRFFAFRKVCLHKTIPILGEFFIGFTLCDTIESKAIVLESFRIDDDIIRRDEIHEKLPDHIEGIIHDDRSYFYYSMLKGIESSHLEIKDKVGSDLLWLIRHEE
jgi:hypothetical protein